MKILLISGFLGAGKTTFIKELIRQTDDNCQCVVIGQGLDEKKIRKRLSPVRKALRL